jgi:Co/Zn/Cd efflux system component
LSQVVFSKFLSPAVSFVRRCLAVRLQSQLFKVDRVLDMHEVHLWQLVDGVVIGTLHLKVARGGDDKKVCARASIGLACHQ